MPENSYLPGLNSVHLDSVLPPFIYDSLAEGFMAFGKKMKGYYTNEAVVVATESRPHSPVRIPRDAEGLQHPQVKNLYPCGEGAGYAGGIVSAAWMENGWRHRSTMQIINIKVSEFVPGIVRPLITSFIYLLK